MCYFAIKARAFRHLGQATGNMVALRGLSFTQKYSEIVRRLAVHLKNTMQIS